MSQDVDITGLNGEPGAEQAFLEQTVQLATESVTNGGGPFGAMIVRDGTVVAIGNNQVTSGLDPTAHAEVVAIRRACQELGDFRLTGCTLVTSCEPCPLCLSAALWARVSKVVYAADRDDAASAGFDDRAFYELFEKPRSSWPIPVDRLSTSDRNAPFDAWSQKTDRVDY